eukprot:TRINITY_DN15684_c0_g1_i1.p1 TRINITY_DN15684_c0_g1~~TRINITY_DN15684_c0_g1_i1.p1  ORF type:complete len:257 (+),score=58.66 TRINITY_DN15684_c0_g1_i1:42-812(+)
MKWKSPSDDESPSPVSSPMGRRDDKKQTWVMSFFLLVVLTVYTTFSFAGKTSASIHNSYIEAYDTVSRQKLRPININDAHAKGVGHWATWVFVVDFGREMILLQKRSSSAVPCEGKWGITGEHMEPNEEVKDTALRGLKEELDINASPTDLILLDNFLWKHVQPDRIDIQNSTVYLYPATTPIHHIKVNEESELAEFVPLPIFHKWCTDDPSKLCGAHYARAFLKYLVLICKHAPIKTAFCTSHYHNQNRITARTR